MRITDLPGITLPIIQAPMLGVSTPQLAAAVSNAGALGSLGASGLPGEALRALIHSTRQLTAHAFNINLFCHVPARPDAAREQAWLATLAPLFAELGVPLPGQLDDLRTSLHEQPDVLQVLLDERPALLSFHFGLPPAQWIDALKAAGIRLIASATCLDEALQIERAGLDAVIAQGVEAGGHRGVFEVAADTRIGTLALVRSLVCGQSLPVIAAGGIMDGAGIAAVQALGASAAQLGTAFVSCPESAAGPAYRRALLAAGDGQTRITAGISGRPARALRNRLVDWLECQDMRQLPDFPLPYHASKALLAALGPSDDYGVHWAGQGASRSRALPAAQLVAQLADEWRAARA